ncbi:stalk domain-containing protein [Butyricicoccus pullicaecorum]|uniref:stalk domain-containing protein n=1 Tax=Butyricicoccus pullicaecorum TaxID=501571 RepID=UPI003990B119
MNLFYKLFRHTQNSHQQTVKYFEGVFKMKKQYVSRRFVGLALIAALTLPTAAAAQANVKQITVNTGITVQVDGKSTKMTNANGNPVEVFEYNGTTYVPLRGVAQTMGANVSYDSATRTAIVNSPSSTQSNSTYTAIQQLYRAAQEMYTASHAMCSLSINGMISNADPIFLEKQYNINMSRYEVACISAISVPQSDPSYTTINEIVSYLDTVKYNYEKTYEVVQNGMFTQVYLDRMSTYDIDGGYAASMALILCNGLLDSLE